MERQPLLSLSPPLSSPPSLPPSPSLSLVLFYISLSFFLFCLEDRSLKSQREDHLKLCCSSVPHSAYTEDNLSLSVVLYILSLSIWM